MGAKKATISDAFAALLRNVRKTRGATLEEIGIQSGVSQRLLSKAERGAMVMPGETFATILHAYGLHDVATMFEEGSLSAPSLEVKLGDGRVTIFYRPDGLAYVDYSGPDPLASEMDRLRRAWTVLPKDERTLLLRMIESFSYIYRRPV